MLVLVTSIQRQLKPEEPITDPPLELRIADKPEISGLIYIINGDKMPISAT